MADRNRSRTGSGYGHQVYAPFSTEPEYRYEPRPQRHRRRVDLPRVFAVVCFVAMVCVLVNSFVTIRKNNGTIANLQSSVRDLQNNIGNYEVRLTMQQDEDRIRDVAENELGMVPADQSAVRVLARDENGALKVYAGGEQ